jgi:histidine decarboxylase
MESGYRLLKIKEISSAGTGDIEKKKENKEERMNVARIVNGAVGAFSQYCAGYLNPGASGLGYIAALKLSAACMKCRGDDGLEISCNRAERNDAYMGQINRMNSSAYCGLNGALWGYDLVRPDEFKNGNINPLEIIKRHDNERIPVWDMQPLLDASERLFGSDEQLRFPLLPGALVPCAERKYRKQGPALIRCFMVLAIVEDRENNADQVLQYAGFKDDSAKAGLNRMSMQELYEKGISSVLVCGENQGVLYKEIFFGYKEMSISEGEVGCAICCMPYITLAQNVIPDGTQPEALTGMTVSQWENALKLPPFKKKK